MTAARVQRGSAAEVTVFGVVQGVGFRPFVYRLATEMGLAGWVQNAGGGVEIHLEGRTPEDIDRFVGALRERLPPLAKIEDLSVRPADARGLNSFEIRPTRDAKAFVFISPDIATCPDCLAEIRDPAERRFRYPFTNCTNCGPRYTIVRSLPYDRPATTMAGFAMCADCRREYEDPLDRRHHAQPIACPVCGPRVTLRNARTGRAVGGGIDRAADLLAAGRILAVKGLGGFHLACDPLNRAAVARLRRIKDRRTKPLALMAADLAAVRTLARPDPEEEALLTSIHRPIVLLRRKAELPGIAPNLDEVGIMLPYTPLHHLLLERIPVIVATSSNRKDAPIMKEEDGELKALCDYILTHDRPIHMRADDSVLKIAGGRPLFVRRARGYVPFPQAVPAGLRADATILAVGGEQKVTVSLYRKGYVVTSQFLGDLDDYQNLGYFEETIAHLRTLFGDQPELVVSDLHPDFASTRAAERMGLPHLRVQHHHAHLLAPLLEHGLEPRDRVLGVAFDGYGYGTDGTAWGGEFLLADYLGFERFAHLAPVALPGGDLAARQPWRMALSHLRDAFGEVPSEAPALSRVRPRLRESVARLIASGAGFPLTSSVGRLFDAVSFLCGLAPEEMEYEAEAAMRLEAAAKSASRRAYPFDLDEAACAAMAPPAAAPGQALRPVSAAAAPCRVVSFAPALRAILRDLRRPRPPIPLIATKFHNTLAEAILRVAETARRERGVGAVVLAGGVFLNRVLLGRTTERLEKAGFEVIRPVRYSPNDESLSLGQIAHGLAYLSGPGQAPRKRV